MSEPVSMRKHAERIFAEIVWLFHNCGYLPKEECEAMIERELHAIIRKDTHTFSDGSRAQLKPKPTLKSGKKGRLPSGA